MARSATLDMTQGSLGRQIIGFSLPLMFTNLLQMLFSMVDLAVVGRFSSSAAMGSVGSTTTLIFLFTGFLMGLGSGVNVLVATHFGARSEKNVRESVHTSFLVCLIAGFLMLALGLIFARPLLELLNTRDDLIDGAELYLRIYFLGMPAAALYNYGNGVLNAIGDTKTPLIFLSTAGVLNVILDLVFVIGLGMSTDGVRGAHRPLAHAQQGDLQPQLKRGPLPQGQGHPRAVCRRAGRFAERDLLGRKPLHSGGRQFVQHRRRRGQLRGGQCG